jgi:hypothetical protein
LEKWKVLKATNLVVMNTQKISSHSQIQNDLNKRQGVLTNRSSSILSIEDQKFGRIELQDYSNSSFEKKLLER